MKVHVIYLTTDCNLNCPYCYERKKKDSSKRATYEEINSFIASIAKEEGSTEYASTLCLLGGEPFLEFDKIEYVFDLCEKLQEDQVYISVNVITNGTLIASHIDSLERMINHSTLSLSLDISYDGINQYLRTGKSTIVEDNIKLLRSRKIPFGISYTVTTNNCDYDILLREMILIMEKFYKGFSTDRTKVKLSIDLQNLSNWFGIRSWEEYLTPIKSKLEYLFSIYGVPFCEVTCNVCKRCRRDLFDGKEYCVPGKKDYIVEAMHTNKGFDHF